VALITNNISGSASNSSLMGITGSVIFANRPDATFPGMPGSDVTFYVSGSANANADVSVFGGDLVVSGGMSIEGNTLEITGSLLVTGSFDLDGDFVVTGDLFEVTGTLIVTEGLSGSLTKLSDGTSYLVEGSNITIVSQSNGSVVISSTGGGGDSFFSSTTAGSIYTTGSAAFSDQESVDSPADKGTDVFFYVSGTIGSKDGATAGLALFGGDVVVSGSMFTEGNRFEMTGTLEVTNGISGSLTQLTDGTSYLVEGSNITIASQSNGSIVISSTGGGDSFFSSTTAGSIYTTGSTAFSGQESIDSPSDKGTDVFFYVSGSKGAVSNEKSLFGGDLVVSGSFVVEGSYLEMTGTIAATQGFSGSLTQLTDGTSYLIEGSNISITSQSNGAITISNTFVQVDDFFDSTTGGSVYTTGSFAFSGQEAIDSPSDKGTDVFFYVSGSSGVVSNEKSLFGGDLVVSGSLFSQGDRLEVTGTILATQGFSGSLTQLTDGTSYLIAGNNISIVTQSNGAIAISNTFVQIDDYFDSTTSGAIFTTGSAAFSGVEAIDSPTDKGTDVFFYVSGSTAAARSAVSLFGGHVLISGSLVQGNFGASGGTTGQYARAHGERTTASGTSSHAEGRFSLAQGSNSHAEGDSTAAYAAGSHAEGLDSATYANYSHAEGRSTEARGLYSHAEGYDSIPRADYSHAEGRDTETIVGALYSHAEGSGSITLGEASHAGGLCTIASGSYQTVIGKYNLRGNTDSLFIVGNGTATSDANRSDVIRVQSGSVGSGQLQVSGSIAVSGSYSGNTNSLAGPGTIGSDGHSMLLRTTGNSEAVTLADGIWPGQLKYVVANSNYGGAGNTTIITPTNALGFTTVTLGADGQAVTFFWTGSNWVVVGYYGATVV
jgi:hypothetical protein